MKRRVQVLLLAAFLGACPSGMSDTTPSASPAPVQLPLPGSDLDGLGRLLPSLVLLLVIAGGAIYFAKNGLPWRGARNATDRRLNITEMRSLGNRQFLVVVEYEETRLLLGVTPGKIDYLCGLESRAESQPDFASLVPNTAGSGGKP